MAEHGPIVSTEWLADHLADVVVADVRWYLDGRSGRAAFEAGHISGARFVDLDVELSAPPTKGDGRHPLPDPEDFAASMRRLGIGDESRVVAYDDAGGTIAARLWWMLDALGQSVAVLDGGIQAWSGPLSLDAPQWEPAKFTARSWPAERIASMDEVEDRRHHDDTLLIDARATERYRGVENKIDARFGHVPGAVSMPTAGNLTDGQMRDAVDLRAAYEAAGAGPRAVIAYCGSGVTACHDLLSLRVAGLPDGQLFVGSWSAWGADPKRPIETDHGP